MTYQPNFSDPRVISRIRGAYLWSVRTFSTTKPKEMSSRVIDKYYGCQSHNLSKWLRAKLLIKCSNYYNPEDATALSYRLNNDGKQRIANLLWPNSTDPIHQGDIQSVDELYDKHQHELSTRTFTYAEKSSRLVHPIQSVRKKHKRYLWNKANLLNEYDIKCCAPTLLLQRACQIDAYFTAYTLQEYIDNRTQWRTELAAKCSIDSSDIKHILHALLFGATLSASKYSSIFQYLENCYENNKYQIIRTLQADTKLQQLRNDIKNLWRVLSTQISRVTVQTKRGQRRKPITASNKAQYYRELELVVGHQIQKYLARDNNRYFWEHDGFTCEYLIDTDDLSSFIRQKTFFRVSFEHTRLDNYKVIA